MLAATFAALALSVSRCLPPSLSLPLCAALALLYESSGRLAADKIGSKLGGRLARLAELGPLR